MNASTTRSRSPTSASSTRSTTTRACVGFAARRQGFYLGLDAGPFSRARARSGSPIGRASTGRRPTPRPLRKPLHRRRQRSCASIGLVPASGRRPALRSHGVKIATTSARTPRSRVRTSSMLPSASSARGRRFDLCCRTYGHRRGSALRWAWCDHMLPRRRADHSPGLRAADLAHERAPAPRGPAIKAQARGQLQPRHRHRRTSLPPGPGPRPPSRLFRRGRRRLGRSALTSLCPAPTAHGPDQLRHRPARQDRGDPGREPRSPACSRVLTIIDPGADRVDHLGRLLGDEAPMS